MMNIKFSNFDPVEAAYFRGPELHPWDPCLWVKAELNVYI